MWRQPNQIDHLRDRALELTAGHAAQLPIRTQQFRGGKPVVEAEVLRQKTNAAPRLPVMNRLPKQQGGTARRFHQAEKHLDRSALPGSIRAQKAKHLTAWHVERESS